MPDTERSGSSWLSHSGQPRRFWLVMLIFFLHAVKQPDVQPPAQLSFVKIVFRAGARIIDGPQGVRLVAALLTGFLCYVNLAPEYDLHDIPVLRVVQPLFPGTFRDLLAEPGGCPPHAEGLGLAVALVILVIVSLIGGQGGVREGFQDPGHAIDDHALMLEEGGGYGVGQCLLVRAP